MIRPAGTTSGGSGGAPVSVVQRAAERYLSEVPGRATRHAFSFGSHYDPDNTGFGPLLVCNDERLGVGQGYPAHRHADAEIVTWVVSGALRHTESSGRSDVVSRGQVQRMSAGSGIVHSEVNDAAQVLGTTRGADFPAGPEPVRFVQMWLRPDRPGGEPGYQQAEIDLASLESGWQLLASGTDPGAPLRIGVAAARLWVGRLPIGLIRTLPEGDATFVQVVTGTVDAGEVGSLAAGDTVRILGRREIRLIGVHPAEVLVWTFGPGAVTEAGR